MKIVVFGPEQRVGVLQAEQVIDLNRANSAIPADLRHFVEGGQQALELAQRAVDTAGSAPEGAVLTAADADLRAPWAERRIACAGGNYGKHLLGMWARRYPDRSPTLEQVEQDARNGGQWGFWKVPDRVAGPEESIAYPKRTSYLDYEGEVAIVIGKRGKNIPAQQLADYVWGVTLLHDWSIRDGGGQPTPMAYNLPKNFDGSTSMGPCIVVGELNPRDVDVELRINGDPRQSYNTCEMIWDFGEILEYLSRDFTFVPGDVIAGGTNAGTAADKSERSPDGSWLPELFLKVGDVVELSSPRIGMLRNRIGMAS
jgi:2-keto-4-pentenoate hydratase/2-oxohepta-3-ene-1,7-dioic acid hydratase in catechol pathway